MATLLAKIQIHPGQENVFEEVMAYMYKQTHETEDDVLRYEYWRGREPNFYYCLLSFKDSLSFWRHQASDHHEGEMERFAACIADLDLEIIDPVSDSSPLPATNEMECPADESDAVKEMAGIYQIAINDWWKSLRK